MGIHLLSKLSPEFLLLITLGHLRIVTVFVLLVRQPVFPAELGQMVSKEEIKKDFRHNCVCLPSKCVNAEDSRSLCRFILPVIYRLFCHRRVSYLQSFKSPKEMCVFQMRFKDLKDGNLLVTDTFLSANPLCHFTGASLHQAPDV